MQNQLNTPKEDIDIKSYKYQLAYYKKRYNSNEIEFIHLAFLVLGSGFYYDQQTGRFIDHSVSYKSEVVEYKDINKEEDNKLYSIYGTINDFSNLDHDWTLALQKLLKTLKEDRPLPFNMDGTDDEKEKKLTEIIDVYEKRLDSLTSSNKKRSSI